MKVFTKKEKPKAEKEKKRKKTLIILLAADAFLIAASVAVLFLIRHKDDKSQMDMPPAMNNPVEGVAAASGLTTVGMLDETWELDFLQTALYVEESYLSMGDEVKEGTAVFKISDETLEKARKELEDAVTEADLAYRQGVIDYEAGVIDARVTKENAAVNKKYGQAQYDNAAAAALKTVKELEEQVEEARELVDEYTKSVNEDYYRTYYKIDELYQTYYEHFSLLMETYEKWDIEEKESLYGNSVPSLGGNSGSSSLGNISLEEQSSKGTAFNTSSSESAYRATNLVLTERSKSDTYSRFTTLNVSSMNNLILASEVTDINEQEPQDTNEMETPGDSGETDGEGEKKEEEVPKTGNGDTPPGDKENMGEEGFGQKGGMPGGAMGGGSMGGGYSESETQLSVYNLLDEMVTQEAEEYKTALENYETAKRTAQAGLDKAQSDLASLEAELVRAQTEYEKQLISCKSDYEITLAESDNAQAVYEVTLESLEETLTSLENEKEDAAENLALFEKVIGDGYFYTQSAGTIVMNGVRKGSYLSGESLIIAYSDPEKVSVTASVNQSDIAGISIGDNAYVVISEYGSYQGKVTMLNPVTQAQSRSSVTYQVTVALEGDVSALDSNLTAYVYFGMTEEMIQEMENMQQGADGNPEGDGGRVPEGGNMPGNGTGMEEIKDIPQVEDGQ